MAGTFPTDPAGRGPIPGIRCVVDTIPSCDFCDDGTPGPYDFATRMGPWAHGCEQHWKLYRRGPLGVGSGQLWVTEPAPSPKGVGNPTGYGGYLREGGE